MNYIADCLNRFRELPLDIKNKIGGFDSVIVIQNIESEYGIDLSFAVILVAIGDLNANDLGKYLEEKYKINEEDSYEIMNELTRKIFSKIFLNSSVDNTSDRDNVKSILTDNFDLLLKNKEAADNFNFLVFKILSSDGSFLLDLSNIIVNNKLKIGQSTILIDDYKVAPTVSNWIKDFNRINGTDIFDNILLAKYISNSENTKKLSEQDKTLLFKVFKIYRNITFFQENTDNLAMDFWEIIPTNDDLNENRMEKIKDDVTVDKIVAPLAGKQSINKNTKESQINDNHKGVAIKELQSALLKYDRNSLEYKAVKQEIEHLRK